MYKNMKKHKKKRNTLWKIISTVKTRNEDSERQKGEVIVPRSRCRSLSKAGLMSSNYWTTSHSFFSILKPLVSGMCPTGIRWVSAHLRKTCSNFPVSGIILESCYFSKNHPFRKPCLSLVPKSDINIFTFTLDAPVFFNHDYPSQTEFFPHDLKARSFMSHSFSNDTLYCWKIVNFSTHFQLWNVPK